MKVSMKTKAFLTLGSCAVIAVIAATLFSAPKKGKPKNVPVNLAINGGFAIVGDGGDYAADLLQGTKLRMSFDADAGRQITLSLMMDPGVADPTECPTPDDDITLVGNDVFAIIAPVDETNCIYKLAISKCQGGPTCLTRPLVRGALRAAICR